MGASVTAMFCFLNWVMVSVKLDISVPCTLVLCYGFSCVPRPPPPGSYVGVLIPGTSDCDLFWRQGPSDDQVNGRPSGWAGSDVPGVLMERGHSLDPETDYARRGHCVKVTVEIYSLWKAKDTSNPLAAGREAWDILLAAPVGTSMLTLDRMLTLGSWAEGF